MQNSKDGTIHHSNQRNRRQASPTPGLPREADSCQEPTIGVNSSQQVLVQTHLVK